MKLIAHRGNLSGPNPETENTASAIDEAISRGFDAEIDVWMFNGKVFLGHDAPSFEIDKKWINERHHALWIHCKNTEAFGYFVEKGFNCFFHDVDAYTLTVDGYIWAYPGMPAAGKKCIAVMPEYVSDVMKYDLSEYFGVCSDYVLSISEAVS
jgi:hypothetical protein